MPKLKDFLEKGLGNLTNDKLNSRNQIGSDSKNSNIDVSSVGDVNLNLNTELTNNNTIMSLVNSFTSLLRYIFSNIDDYIWSANEKECITHINSLFAKNKAKEAFPMILVKYAGLGSQRISNNGVGHNFKTYIQSSKSYATDMVRQQQTQIIFEITAESDTSAVNIANIIFDYIQAMAPSLSPVLGIEYIQDETMSPPMEILIKEEQLVYQVNINFTVKFIRQLTIHQFSEWFDTYRLNLETFWVGL
jgi:hypothetical protein